jgi:hypothetical protein
LTTGTRRNGTSKLGPFTWPATPQYGEPGRQALDGRAVLEFDSFDGFDGFDSFDSFGGFGESSYRDYPHGDYGYAPYDDPRAYGDAGPVGYVPTVQVVQSALVDHEAGPHEPRDAGPAPQPGRTAGRYAGRHVSTRAKTARKRARRVVPVAAVAAATIAAGSAAAYGLTSGGQPQSGNLNASLALHGGVASTPAFGAGKANGSSAAPISVATATASGTAHVPKHAKAAPRSTPATTPPAAPKHAAPAASAPAAPAHAAAAAPTASSPAATTKPAAATTLSCNLNYGMLPENVTAIVSFLLANGYTDNAAAGIAGNIYQESKGNVESVGMGGGGLIGWTPLPSGFVTGNVSADLQTQLSALLTYNQGWAQFLPALNSAASPAAAADIYVTDFERAGIPAASTREASAQNVASACGI